MNKPIIKVIKIIKRKDVEAAANVKLLNAHAASPALSNSKAKTARHSQRELTAAILKWIPEQRHNRLEEVSAVQRFFGSDLLLSKI